MNPVPIRLLHHTRSYERLSPQDASFLVFEKPDLPLHVGMVAFFERGSFALPTGDIDLARFQRYILSRVPGLPRCRQKLAYIPFSRQPVWVDDPDFRIERHVRDVRLAGGSDEAALQVLAGELFTAHLDRAKPLWEVWVVQGFDDPDRLAVICKIHHSMIDGIAAIDFIGALLSQEPATEIAAIAPYEPRPAPHPVRLVVDEAARMLKASAGLALGSLRFARSPIARAGFRERAEALVRMLARGMRGTSDSPLGTPALARRQFAWTTTERTPERLIRTRLGGSRDDIAVTTATGATRTHLIRHGANPRRLRVRAMTPMSVRSRAERGRLGNRVSMLIVELPVGEERPEQRLSTVSEHVLALKAAKQGLGVDVLGQIDRWTGTAAQSLGMWIATRFRAYNLLVTNVPGPPVPLYALDAKMLAMHPLGPIFGGHHISVATMTYLGRVHWGVQYGGPDADGAAQFAADLRDSFDELVAAAESAPPRLHVVEPSADAPARTAAGG